MAGELEKFYDGLQTVPKLLSDMAMGVAQAQQRLDQDYIQSLTQFSRIVYGAVGKAKEKPEEFLTLFKAVAPSRYQFTETVLEVRADLQMSTFSELGISGSLGIKAAMFAVSVNASYTRRSAYDYRASALIRATLHAIPAEPGLLDKLLPRAGDPKHAELPDAGRFSELAEAFTKLLEAPKAGGGGGGGQG